MEVMKVPQAKSRISIAPSMLERDEVHSGEKGGMALPIMISPAQKRTLKKGGAITIKPDMIMKEAKEALSLLPASAKKIMSSIVKNKGIRHTLKQGEDLVNRMTGKGLFEDFFTKTLPKVGHDMGRAFAPIPEVNPFDLGYKLGNQVIGPALVGKGMKKRRSKKKGKGAFEDFFTKTIPRAFKGKVKEYVANPQNIVADVLDAQSPIKIPVINKNPEALLMRGKGGKYVSTRNGCGTAYLSKPYQNAIALKNGGSFVAAGGGLYPSGISGRGIDTPIQLGSPYLKENSPAMTPFIPTRGIQSSQIIR